MTITIVTPDDVETIKGWKLASLYWKATDSSTDPKILYDIHARLRSYRAFAEDVRRKLDLDLRQEHVPRPFRKWWTAYKFVSDLDTIIKRINIALS